MIRLLPCLVLVSALTACGARSAVADSRMGEDGGLLGTEGPTPVEPGPVDPGDDEYCAADGKCTPGTSCKNGCTWCSCDDEGHWSCGTLCNEGGDAGASACPAVAPRWEGAYCEFEGMTCDYENGCGGIDRARCVPMYPIRGWTIERAACSSCPSTFPVIWGDMPPCSSGLVCTYPDACGGSVIASCAWNSGGGAAWSLSGSSCVPAMPTCPAEPPKATSSCPGYLTCSYQHPCDSLGATVGEFASCEAAGSQWIVATTTCPPSPAPCPSDLPAPGSACSSFSDCHYDNGCGSVTTAHCTGAGGWALFDPGCVDGCLANKPVSGTPCQVPSSKPCVYVAGAPACTSTCFCAEDGRWACLEPSCE